ncbi:hypothetical protein LJC36_02415 [Desulfovibrio sp. OttesenSCG-928-C14]|nr:hypothetical protein [Desulfovibrio sp. OttesenSCG-928-C14]
MICPFCKEEIADEAIKCKHCKSMLTEQPSEPSQQANSKDSAEDSEQQLKLRSLFEGKNYRVVLGIPLFSNIKDQLKACWWLGLPYAPANVLVYLISGMLKKALVLAVLYVLVFLLAKVDLTGLALILLLMLAFYVVAAMRHDQYRKQIRKEKDFWW